MVSGVIGYETTVDRSRKIYFLFFITYEVKVILQERYFITKAVYAQRNYRELSGLFLSINLTSKNLNCADWF